METKLMVNHIEALNYSIGFTGCLVVNWYGRSGGVGIYVLA